jgi:hypothetical protein
VEAAGAILDDRRAPAGCSGSAQTAFFNGDDPNGANDFRELPKSFPTYLAREPENLKP